LKRSHIQKKEIQPGGNRTENYNKSHQ
jgi:hypothetical protein